MTPNEFRDTIYKAFLAGWGSASLFTFANEKFDPPDPTDPSVVRAGTKWVRLSVIHQGTRQKTLGKVGARKFEHAAKIILQIFTVPNTGLSGSDELAQLFITIFDTDVGRNDVFGGSSSYRERGTAEGWSMSEAWVEYTYDETR